MLIKVNNFVSSSFISFWMFDEYESWQDPCLNTSFPLLETQTSFSEHTYDKHFCSIYFLLSQTHGIRGKFLINIFLGTEVFDVIQYGYKAPGMILLCNSLGAMWLECSKDVSVHVSTCTNYDFNAPMPVVQKLWHW